MTGELLALGAAFAFALSSVAIAKGAQTSSGESGVLLSAIATGLFAGLAWFATGGGPVRASAWHLAGIATVWFVASGLLATVWGRITMYWSIELAGVIRASTTRRLMPFMSVILAWLALGETVSGMAAAGMALIAASFYLLYRENSARIRISGDDPARRAMISRGLVFGVVSALLYALSFVARKFGLEAVPDAFFGAFVGSVTAIVFYAGAALVSTRYRTVLAGVLKAPNPWQVMAAVLIAAGQLSQFAALKLTGVGRVAFINSVEVYIAAFLAVAVFKTEPMPGRAIIMATLLATAGVVLMSLPG
ncbi:EamA family transporter [Zhengella sp. ZM62]|uniref:EamA family transporter n=1 Tax=Zhengella sedimenti TaxID=3390035 RepID=UPI003975B3B4